MTVLVNEKKHIKHVALALKKNDYFSLAINFESMRPSLPDIQSHILLSKKRKLKVTGTSSGDFSPQFRFSRNLEAEVILKHSVLAYNWLSTSRANVRLVPGPASTSLQLFALL